MATFAGITANNQIKVISNEPINSKELSVIEIPADLQDKNLAELVLQCKIRNGKLVSKCKPGKPERVALVSNWKMRCGIATYAEYLYQQLVPKLPDCKLFIEHNDNPTSPAHQLGSTTLNPNQVVECWKRGEPLTDLIAAIKDYDPDVILINHEFGIFPIARYWLSLLTQLSEYRIIATLHSVFPNHFDKTVVEASIPEIVVHLEGAKTALINKGVSGKVHVIPHGCYTADQTKLWNIYRSEHTFVQAGFLLPYKRFQDSIRAVSILKSKFPDVFFTGICSETDFNAVAHQTYYTELLGLINELDLANNVALIRGFQTDLAISSYLRTNQVAVFPYGSDKEHTVYGASGASRLAMAAGVPVITSSVPHFEDLPTIKADGPEAMAEALEKLFTDKTARKEQVEKQNAHIAANSWAETADRYLEVLGA